MDTGTAAVDCTDLRGGHMSQGLSVPAAPKFGSSTAVLVGDRFQFPTVVKQPSQRKLQTASQASTRSALSCGVDDDIHSACIASRSNFFNIFSIWPRRRL